MDTITVTARRWAHGWELEIDPDNITQVRSLESAAQQVRDYLGTLYPQHDYSTADVHIEHELGPIGAEVTAARAATQDAHDRQTSAARRTRAVVAALSAEGYSGTDIAAILGVTRGRVSQLLKDSDTTRAA